MAGEKAFSLVCAVLTVLLVRGNLVQMKPPSISCSLGETGFLNSSLVELIRYSDVVLAGRVIDTERGEFGGSNAIVSYFFAYKTDGLLIRRLVWYTTVVGFSSPPPRGQLNLFFLMRQPTTMTLSLLCMSNNSAIWSENSINYIKEASRSESNQFHEKYAKFVMLGHVQKQLRNNDCMVIESVGSIILHNCMQG